MTDEEKINNVLLDIDKELKKLSVCMNEGFARIEARCDRIEANVSKFETSLKTTVELLYKHDT